MIKSQVNRFYLAMALGAICLGSCVALDGKSYKSGCLSISGGEFSVDLGAGTFDLEAMNISVDPPPCPQMGSVDVETGVDTNGNGKLDEDEVLEETHDTAPGGSTTTSGVSGGTLPTDGEAVIRVIVVKDEDGNVMHSSTESSKKQ